jgi:hypothetical protein
VNGGSGEILVGAELEITGGDNNDDGRIQLSELGSLQLGFGTAGSYELDLPLNIELGGFDLSDYGTPTLRVSDETLFDGKGPQVVVDIRISEELKAEILRVLGEIDAKIGSALSSAEGVLNTEIPGIGKKVKELLGVKDLSKLGKLREAAEPYLNKVYEVNEFPTLSGLLDVLRDALKSAGAVDIDLDSLVSAGKSFAARSRPTSTCGALTSAARTCAA